MKINHNPAALSTLGALQRNTSNSQQSLQRLSTGQKINKAADDASGLAISQKMQAQINGLAQAGQNAQDGANLVQTAEGAMGDIQDILQKLRTMAVQARNDTQSDTDKGNLQDQADALTDEIGRIAQETTFNTKRILQSYAGEGIFSTDGLNLQVGADAGQNINLQVGDPLWLTTLSFKEDTSSSPVVLTGASSAGATATLDDGDGGIQTFRFTFSGGYASGAVLSATVQTTDGSGYTLPFWNGSSYVDLTLTATVDSTDITKVTISHWIEKDSTAMSDNATQSNGGVDPYQLGLSKKVANSYFTHNVQLTDANAISVLDSAIGTVSHYRSQLGAYQNRLAYVDDVDDIAGQNLTQAMSGILDTDIAAEMIQTVKSNILVQSAQAMLAQANSLPQGMLTLLHG